jgi:hypothetical protein
MKRFMQTILSIPFFFIYDAIVSCELFGDDKILGFYRNKFSLLFILSL